MRTISNDIMTVTYPNSFSFTNSRHQYVMYEVPSSKNGTMFLLRIEYGNYEVTMQRVARNGRVVFPLTSVLESFARQSDEKVMKGISLYINDSTKFVDLDVVVVGSYDYEVPDFDQVNANGESLVNKIGLVLYPNFQPEDWSLQYVPFFIGPTGTGNYQSRMSLTLASGKTQIVSITDSEYPFFHISLRTSINKIEERGEVYFHGFSPKPSFGNVWLRQPVTVDWCTDGIFLKWTDKSGVPRLYRWTVESTADEVEVEETYTCLDATLQPYDVQDRTLTRRYVLHSRLVEQDVFDLCKSVIGGRDVFMWDEELSEWVRCYVDDSEIEDTGDLLNDMTIEVVKKEYHI